MNEQELQFILQEGEGFKIEFKESLKNIDKEIIAFANSSGGKIFIGITDDGKIKGINITNRLKSQIQDLARNCDPEIKIKLETFESRIELHALLNPSSKDVCKSFPNFNSSFILSKINTFASTAIPTERINPATPANVKVTGIILNNASTITEYISNAKFANAPGNL